MGHGSFSMWWVDRGERGGGTEEKGVEVDSAADQVRPK